VSGTLERLTNSAVNAVFDIELHENAQRDLGGWDKFFVVETTRETPSDLRPVHSSSSTQSNIVF